MAAPQQLQAQQGREYFILVQADTVKYRVLEEKKVLPENSINRIMVGHILLSDHDQSSNFYILKEATSQISKKHGFEKAFFYSSPATYEEVIEAKEQERNPDEDLMRNGFICQIHGNIFRMTYYDW